jgi:hypothetical protein
MSEMIPIKRVSLGEHHLRPGRTKHLLFHGEGRNEFPPFSSLVIAQHPANKGYFLLYLCENGQGTDTYHLTLDDALHQAKFEFEVEPEEWEEAEQA